MTTAAIAVLGWGLLCLVVIALLDTREAQQRQRQARKTQAATARRVELARAEAEAAVGDPNRCVTCRAGDVTQFRCGYCGIGICAKCAVDGMCRECARGAG